jgi:ABC-2 type transport system ATP-binding protein
VVITVLACAAALGCGPASAWARDDTVTSFDGTKIAVHLFGPTTPPPGGRAPTVLVGAPYPSPGETRADIDSGDRIGLATLRAAGYNVLTWDPRGIGDSGGAVMFDSPAFEGRDARALVDYVAAQPEALLDAPGDPRIGMSGTSYGAGIQLIAAATDPRIDAIVPDLGWHSLVTSLRRGGSVKTGWLAPLCGLDVVPGAVDGRATAADVRPLSSSLELKAACVEGVAGALSSASRKFLADNGPGALVRRIRAPTLLTQATTDTLFPLGEAIENYDELRDNGVPVKMIWYCGGHGECPTEAGDSRFIARQGLAWLDRWLSGRTTVDTGPAFQWFADDAKWRAGPDYPLAGAGSLDTVGAGSLQIARSNTPAGGLGRAATVARDGVDAPFPSPSADADVLGTPYVRVTYRGVAKPARTHLYAQIVDTDAESVVDDQATPLPVILDGRLRSVRRPLEAIAVRASPASDYSLQITGGAATYTPQPATGRVSVYGAFGSLPLVDATRSGRGSAPRTPRRPRLAFTSSRAGAIARVRVRARLRSGPCAGTVTFVVKTTRQPHYAIAPVRTRPCRAAQVVRLRVPAGTRLRVSATFNGNAKLKGRGTPVVQYRVK